MQPSYRNQLSFIVSDCRTTTSLKILLLQGFRENLKLQLHKQEQLCLKKESSQNLLSDFNQIYRKLSNDIYQTHLQASSTRKQYQQTFGLVSSTQEKQMLQKICQSNNELKKLLHWVKTQKQQLRIMSERIQDDLKCKRVKAQLKLNKVQSGKFPHSKHRISKSMGYPSKQNRSSNIIRHDN